MRPVILTIMCMVEDNNGRILVENRLKKDWPGLTFPGGHVEDDETCEEACIREIKEETGLEVSDLIEMGHIEWNNEFGDGLRHFSMLYKTKTYKGKLKSSKEGEVFFVDKKDLNKYPFSNDFDKILAIMLK
ncbi:MAG: NUDIX domain-containing protein [Bacilli bacterium]|nr:NUDIX domain-containing protein [Bacilli bacterium]